MDVNNFEILRILKAEIKAAMNLMQPRKTTGSDYILADCIRLFDDKSLKRLTDLFNKIYVTIRIPDEWLKSTFILLPKGKYPKACGDFRTVSLMSHLLKIFLRIIHNKCESVLSDM